MDFLWKAVVVILNRRFTTSITCHDSLRGFLAGHGTGTTTLGVKLLREVAAMREAVLHEIFLGLHKAYYALDRSRCLEILEGYGMGDQGPPPPLQVMCEASDGGAVRGLLRSTLLR